MKNIDFLPPRYRERHRQRQAFVWEIAVVGFFGLLIAAAAAWQVQQRWQVGRQLAALEGRFQETVDLRARQQQLQSRLAAVAEVAELYLYLEHPWPRTQVLHVIGHCLPDGMSLTDVHIAYETTAALPLDEAELKKLSPAKRDLARLRRETDGRVVDVKIAGTTEDARQIYHFAQGLGQSPPLATVKLETAENQSDKVLKRTGFRLRGVLEPGYFQPGGPEHFLAEKRP